MSDQVVVESRRRRVWDVEGWEHRLSCGCYWFDRGIASGTLLQPDTRPYPKGTEVYCSTHPTYLRALHDHVVRSA